VETRLGRLPPATHEVLRLAAVVGREFDFELVKQAAATDEEALVDALEAAEQAQVIREVRGRGRETYAFAHALVPTVLRESLTGVRRHRLHRRLAAALQALRPEDFASLAFHWGQAGDEEQAMAYLVRAADQARRVYANQDAIRFYSEALALTPEDDPARFDLLAARAAVYDLVARRAEQQADVEAMLALAERENDDARRCDALLALADLFVETDSPRSREPAERAALIARQTGDRVREGQALRRLGWSSWLRVGHAESRRALETAVELFREVGLPGEAAICLHTLSITLVQLGEFEDALRTAEEAVALSRSAGDRRQEAIGLRRVAIAHLCLWRMAEALPCAEAALARHRELGDRAEESNALHVLAGIFAWTAQPEQADRCLREAYELAEAIGGGPAVALVATSRVTDTFRPRGEFAAGLEFLDGILAKPHLAANKMIDGFARWLKAMLLIDLGQFAASLETIEAVLPSAERQWGPGFQIFVLSCAGRAHAGLGHWRQARDVLATALELAERTGARFSAGLPLAFLAQAALLEGSPAGLPAGLGHARRAVEMLAGCNIDWADTLADGWHVQAQLHLTLAAVEPGAGHAQAALDTSRKLMQFAESHPARLTPAQFAYTHSRCLRALGREAEADDYLRRAGAWIDEVAARTPDAALRQGWLENICLNRQALAELHGSPAALLE
jgi:tetratricopeptide (TPR) repeat protein